eukprot:TRINITY_DN39045_c0_g2_i4.p1 TRINITY_DN39045_c0_g2~~TRINITY_DN39045_c0_g2_i4.p1  ORF type:complete len:281 (-),score=46.50 TRINITY_DN39045_c0_g2_i4:29-871(-)
MWRATGRLYTAALPRREAPAAWRVGTTTRLRGCVTETDGGHSLEQQTSSKEMTMRKGMSRLTKLAKDGRWQKACYTLEEMRTAKVAPNLVAYSLAASACSKQTRWRGALSLWQTVEDAADLRPDGHFLATTLSCLGRSPAWLQALRLFGQVTCQGQVQTTVYHYGAVIGACMTGSHWQGALDLLHQGLAAARTAAERPDATCFGSAITACRKAQQWERALLLLTAMDASGVTVDVLACSAAIAACDSVRHWRAALALLRSLEGRKLRPSTVSCSASRRRA